MLWSSQDAKSVKSPWSTGRKMKTKWSTVFSCTFLIFNHSPKSHFCIPKPSLDQWFQSSWWVLQTNTLFNNHFRPIYSADNEIFELIVFEKNFGIKCANERNSVFVVSPRGCFAAGSSLGFIELFWVLQKKIIKKVVFFISTCEIKKKGNHKGPWFFGVLFFCANKLILLNVTC